MTKYGRIRIERPNGETEREMIELGERCGTRTKGKCGHVRREEIGRERVRQSDKFGGQSDVVGGGCRTRWRLELL